jgi:hypothetical protein
MILPLLEGNLALVPQRLSEIASVSLQFFAVSPLAFAFLRFFGPLPLPANRFYLKKNRLGSLIRYLGDIDATST